VVSPAPDAVAETDSGGKIVSTVLQEGAGLVHEDAATIVTVTAGGGRAAGSKRREREGDREAREQDLLHRARAEDVLHWQEYHRHISAETLAKRLHVGSRKARMLVTRLRSDTHGTLDNQTPP
jgi:hypothetical protein